MSNANPTTARPPRGARPVKFVYLDSPGSIDTFGYVLWGSAGFHVDAAPKAMLPVIESALRRRIAEMERGQP